MCFYILRLPVCGHITFPPQTRIPILLHTFCRAFETELQRIHTDPDAWSTPAARLCIPFTDPPSCTPRWASDGNIFVQWRGYCGTECENSFLDPALDRLESETDDGPEGEVQELEAEKENPTCVEEGGAGCGKVVGVRRRRKLVMRRMRGEKGAIFGVKREGIGWREG